MGSKEVCYDYYTVYSILYYDRKPDGCGLLIKAIKDKKIATTSDRKINVDGCVIDSGSYIFCGEDGSVAVHDYNCTTER